MATHLKLLLLLPLLGMSLRGGDSVAVGTSNSKLLAILNATAPALDVLLHIDVLSGDSAPLTTAVSPLSLESIIRAEVNGDWERGRLVLQLANEARTLELKHAIYEALWLELQQTKQIYDPLKILDFYEQLEHQTNVPPALLQKVYVSFVSRSAQLLSAPFHTNSRSANFPLVTTLLQRLTLSTLDYIRDILEALFDAVLALESSLSVVQRLGNYTASLTQLTVANLQLLKRNELQLDSTAQTALQLNLRQLLEQPNFGQEVERSLRIEVYAQLPPNERVLYTAQKVCLRNVTNENAYVYECPQTYLICTNPRDPKKAAYYVQRGHGGANNSLQFAFYSAYWRNRYILMQSNDQTTVNANANAIKKNVYSNETIYWWHVLQVQGGVALYDAATSGSVLCGGNSAHWDGVERHVYTRHALEFEANRRECTWSLEDCSDVA
ncbi:uncharacterized protein LOC133842954 [Drosophila sulfurigaster albostrigata]|uniref:uncharacterized protein LOC133842954 n=1 Tax=Drosophila sulfurigaster albostrigata TaxID=89887 RepID=UPI002D219C8A|nr:uncharacterized protein LOC133842954 [Drosophila sulfurigaster albostrigata]